MTEQARNLRAVIRSAFAHSGRRPVVLAYHGFTLAARDDDPENLFVTLAAFERQLDYLLDHGWTPLDVPQFLAALDGGRNGKSFLLTIDDGFESVANLAIPALRARAVPTLFFVPAGLVGATADWLPSPPDERLVDAQRLRALAQDPHVEVGAHGFEHVDMRGLDSRQLARQTEDACRALGDITRTPIKAFAYPYGAHDAAARQAVARAGCVLGFSVFDDEGRFAISRVDVNATDTLASFRLKLVPGYRTWWRATGRVAVVRRLLRRTLTHRARDARRVEQGASR
jgi:peptidoglycan/xylan/chitin deacetylase (PgdA/CDA1 family)